MITISDIGLFLNLASQEGGVPWDLHNDYDFHSYTYSENEFILSFIAHANNQLKLDIKFSEADLVKVKFAPTSIEYTTIDQLYRGRFISGDQLLEASSDGKYYYYIDFLGDFSLELLARKLEFSVTEK